MNYIMFIIKIFFVLVVLRLGYVVVTGNDNEEY